MPEIPRTKFNSPWTVAVIEAALNDVSSAKGSSESLTAALNAMRAEINSLSGGVHLKGAVDYYNDLPSSPSEGDAYTVRYQGASGTDPLGIEYAWANYQGTTQWIPIGVDPSVFAKQAEMNVVANAGAKNRLMFDCVGNGGYAWGSTYTHKGITYTVTGDGTISAYGTCSDTENSFGYLGLSGQHVDIDGFCNGLYVVSGCPSGGSTSTWRMYVTKSGYGSYSDTGGGVLLPDRTSSTGILICCLVSKGTTIPQNNPLIFKPMIRPAAITDPTFVPYAKTNRELTVAEDEDRAALVDSGAKNIFDIQHPSSTRSTTYTAISDGGIELTCTDAVWTQYMIDNIPVESGNEYVFASYVDEISGTNTLRIYIRETNSSGNLLYDSGNIPTVKTLTATITPNTDKIWVGIYLNNSATAKTASAKIRAMICTAADYAISPAIVPYAPTNRELYETCETKVTMQQVYGDAILIPANSDLNNYTTPGLYYALVADVPTIINTPYNATGLRLVVEKNTLSGVAVFQTIYPTSRQHLEFFRRVYEGGSWSSWYKFEGTKVT